MSYELNRYYRVDDYDDAGENEIYYELMKIYQDSDPSDRPYDAAEAAGIDTMDWDATEEFVKNYVDDNPNRVIFEYSDWSDCDTCGGNDEEDVVMKIGDNYISYSRWGCFGNVIIGMFDHDGIIKEFEAWYENSKSLEEKLSFAELIEDLKDNTI